MTEQLRRITNPDMREEYLFVAQAVDSSVTKRDDFFKSLLLAENRTIEPWTARALGYLNHRTRQKEAVKYIRPALDALTDVHRTGDIFFPTNWCATLLGGHHTQEAREIVDKFFADNPQYHKMLANKIRQQSNHLYRKNPS